MSLTTFSSADEWQQDSVRWLKERIERSVEERGCCVLGLSGGGTPKPVYAALATAVQDWSSVTVFLVDERCVPATDAASNHALLLEHFYSLIKNAKPTLILPDTQLEPTLCALRYDKQLRELFAAGPADAVVLGMGNDGHTASLFPPLADNCFGPALAVHTVTDSFVVHDRISVTLPVLTQSRAQLLLLQGADKADTWKRMLEDGADERRWPLLALAKQGTMAVHHCT